MIVPTNRNLYTVAKCFKRFKSVVKITEMGARDGLQNERVYFPLDLKVEMINKLSGTGLSKIESSSFVNPVLVPQFIDSDQVMARITRNKNVKYAALVPNVRGMKKAIEAKADAIAIFGATNDVFSKRNINCTVEESFVRFKEVMAVAKDHNMPVRGCLSVAFGCPFTGKIEPGRVADLAKRLFDIGCFEVAIGDTNGVGIPDTVGAVIEACSKLFNPDKLVLHCHDTNGMAIANITRAIELGVRSLDSSIAGLGGCPFAGPGITGNVATEKVVDLLYKLDMLEEGIDRDEINKVAKWVKETLAKLKKELK